MLSGVIKIPNWCSNTLEVSGPVVHLLAFKNYAHAKNRYGQEKVLCEDRFIPYPQKISVLDAVAHAWVELSNKFAKENGAENFNKLNNAKRTEFKEKYGDEPTDGFNQGGYGWASDKWGTKWGFCEVDLARESLEGDDGFLTYTFDSAWSPPIPLVKKMGSLFPKLMFELEYSEPGMAFKGDYVVHRGKITKNDCVDMHFCPECYTDLDEPMKNLQKCEECDYIHKVEKKKVEKK